jgi:hypothetical protein
MDRDEQLVEVVNSLREAVERKDKPAARNAILEFLERTGLRKSDLQRRLNVPYHEILRWLDEAKKNMPDLSEVARFAAVVDEEGQAGGGQKPVYPVSIGVFTWPQVLERYDSHPSLVEVWIFGSADFIDAKAENIGDTIERVQGRAVGYYFVYPGGSPGEQSIKVLNRHCRKHVTETVKGTITGFKVGMMGELSLAWLYDRMRCVLFILKDDIAGFLSIPVEDKDIDALHPGPVPDTNYDYIWKQVSNDVANRWRTAVCEPLLERLDEELGYEESAHTESTLTNVTVEFLLPDKAAREPA